MRGPPPARPPPAASRTARTTQRRQRRRRPGCRARELVVASALMTTVGGARSGAAVGSARSGPEAPLVHEGHEARRLPCELEHGGHVAHEDEADGIGPAG